MSELASEPSHQPKKFQREAAVAGIMRRLKHCLLTAGWLLTRVHPLTAAVRHPYTIHVDVYRMVAPWPTMFTNSDQSPLTTEKSRQILVMSTVVTSISWCRKGSIRTVPISFERQSATNSNVTPT